MLQYIVIFVVTQRNDATKLSFIDYAYDTIVIYYGMVTDGNI